MAPCSLPVLLAAAYASACLAATLGQDDADFLALDLHGKRSKSTHPPTNHYMSEWSQAPYTASTHAPVYPAYTPPPYAAPVYAPAYAPAPPAYTPAPPVYTPAPYSTPVHTTPAYAAPTYAAPAPPVYATPTYVAPAYTTPAYAAPAYSAPAHTTPAYASPAYAAVPSPVAPYTSAPPMHTHKKHKETAYATAIPTEPSITYAQWLVESAYATSSVSSEPVKYHSQPQPSSVAYKAEQPYRAETHPRMFSPEEVDEIVRDRELVLRQIIGKLALLAPSPTAVPAHSSATAAA